MKHKFAHLIFYFSFAILLLGFEVKSQSFVLLDKDKNDITGKTIRCSDTSTDGIMKAYVLVKNKSAAAKNVKVKKREISVIQNTENLFCWGENCYPTTVFTSPNAFSIDAGATTLTKNFYGEYSPKFHRGTTTIVYTFFDADQTSDSAKVTVQFDYLTPSRIEKTESTDLNVFPNPADAKITFSYIIENSAATIQIFNIAGILVKKLQLTPNSREINCNVSDLPSGVYFYSLTVAGKTIKAKKLIVKH